MERGSWEIEVDQGLLCFSDFWGITTYGLIDPERPTFLSYFDTPKSARKISLQCSLVYVADEPQAWLGPSSALSIVDVSVPSEPVLTDTVLIPGEVGDVLVVNSTAYVSSRTRIHAIDVTNPYGIDEISSIYTPSRFRSLIGYGSYLIGSSIGSSPTDGLGTRCDSCFCQGFPVPGTPSVIDRGDIEVLDVSDPAGPCTVATIPGAGLITRLVLGGHHAYVLGKDRQIQIVDLTSTPNPEWLGTIDTDHVVDALAVAGDVLALGGYVPPFAQDSAGISLWDIADPTDPQLLGTFNNWFGVSDIAVRYPYVFVAAGGNGLEVVDFSDLSQPEYLGRWPMGGASDVLVEGNLAYVADADTGLFILDVTDPANVDPFLVAKYSDLLEVDIFRLAKQGAILYANSHVFDVSDPSQPDYLGTTPGVGEHIAVAEDHPNLLFKTEGESGLTVVDVSDPTNATIVAQYDTRGAALEVAADSTYVYVADTYGLLRLRLPGLSSAEDNTYPDSRLPHMFSLGPNYPNPFNPTTTIAYEIPRRGSVKLTVYNVLGRVITTLVDTEQPAGRHTVTWDGRDSRGDRVASGVYLYRLTVGDASHTRKMLLLK